MGLVLRRRRLLGQAHLLEPVAEAGAAEGAGDGAAEHDDQLPPRRPTATTAHAFTATGAAFAPPTLASSAARAASSLSGFPPAFSSASIRVLCTSHSSGVISTAAKFPAAMAFPRASSAA